jgi:hypothetical protein
LYKTRKKPAKTRQTRKKPGARKPGAPPKAAGLAAEGGRRGKQKC